MPSARTQPLKPPHAIGAYAAGAQGANSGNTKNAKLGGRKNAMPYIDPNRRILLKVMPNVRFNDPGELNYSISVLLGEYVRQNGLSYQHISDCLGALEGAKQEFYRCVAEPYEQEKLMKNGAVY
jgi:hypothetical protein